MGADKNSLPVQVRLLGNDQIRYQKIDFITQICRGLFWHSGKSWSGPLLAKFSRSVISFGTKKKKKDNCKFKAVATGQALLFSCLRSYFPFGQLWIKTNRIARAWNLLIRTSNFIHPWAWNIMHKLHNWASVRGQEREAAPYTTCPHTPVGNP